MIQTRKRLGFLAAMAIVSVTFNLSGAAYEPRLVLK